LKVVSVSDAVTLVGRVFQTRGAATTNNTWSPIVVQREDGVTMADVDAGRSIFLESMSATQRSSHSPVTPMQASKDAHKEFKLYPLWHPQPVKVTSSGVIVFVHPRRANKSCSGVHHRLQSVELVAR